jgi:hypothetical protein
MADDTAAENWAQSLLAGLYDHLLLRDVMAKVVPGVLVIATWMLGGDPLEAWPRRVPDWSAQAWVAVMILGWSLGFAVQSAGLRTGAVLFRFRKTRPYRFVTKTAGGEVFDCVDVRTVGTEADWNANDEKLHVACRRSESLKDARQRERLVVVKEACGNTATAMLVVAANELAYMRFTSGAVALAVAVLLAAESRSALRQQYRLMAAVVGATATAAALKASAGSAGEA